MIEFLAEAFSQLRPNEGMTYNAGLPINVSKIKYDNDSTLRISKDELDAKIAELQAVEPLRQLRIQRNQLLAQTDWRMTTDYPYNDQAQWASYRTQLRNLPQTANPTLDENGNLVVHWPTPPSQL